VAYRPKDASGCFVGGADVQSGATVRNGPCSYRDTTGTKHNNLYHTHFI
jgi:hypothetical protein